MLFIVKCMLLTKTLGFMVIRVVYGAYENIRATLLLETVSC